jgi:Fe-S cluster assembly protein SufD
MTTKLQLQKNEDQIRWYQSSFERLEKGLNGQSGSALHQIRRAAFEHFSRNGFPTTHEEEWRFTNVAPIANVNFHPVLEPPARKVSERELARWRFDRVKAHQLVFVDGHFVPELSTLHVLPPGVKLVSLAAAVKSESALVDQHLTRYARFETNPFTALSTAFIQDGAFVYLPDNTVLAESIHLLFYATDDGNPFVVHPRILIVTGKNCRCSVVETFVGSAGTTYLTNVVTEIVTGEGTVLEHDKLQLESSSGFHIGATHLHMHQNSRLTSNAIALGGLLVRNNVTAFLAGEGIECTLNGLSLSTGRQLIDNHTTIDHASPNCSSHELYKAILDGKSHGVFNGKIYVRKGAQKTDAKQTNKTLVLSDEATIDTKPQLEIFADDVKCTHGATVGQLDEDQVFYLRSRGISEIDARDLLTFAFASDIVNRVHVAPLREQLETMIRARLHHGRVASEP